MEGGNHIDVILNDQAHVQDAEPMLCDACEERVVFHLRDSQNRDFAVGLTTMLACIEFAIRQGELPKLPAGWCASVGRAYGLAFDEDAMMWANEQ
ncbi:MAG: hypothetical protein LUE86_05475 [Clostridiales bacterium]|nr:hypothetical protein [Clostridiales bacterium]